MNSNSRDGLSSNKDYEFLVPEELKEESILFSLILLRTCFTSVYNYLLFYTLVEIFSTAVLLILIFTKEYFFYETNLKNRFNRLKNYYYFNNFFKIKLK